MSSLPLFILASTVIVFELLVAQYVVYFFTVVPCILILSKSFVYQPMHNKVVLKEY